MTLDRWSVWLAGLDPVVGSEQGKTRPVLIISKSALNQILPVVNVVPLTTRKQNRRIYPNEALIEEQAANLPNESIALCYQVRTVDKRRLLRKIGDLDDSVVQDDIIAALCFQLEIV
ncbi:MAG: type II toxin-antitoxin system PemK/MazF family toxin [Pyrinomonadaceae bacterium]